MREGRMSNEQDGSFIAKTIVNQLGGNKFIAMTGAKKFAFDMDTNRLTFKIGKNVARVNKVEITLNGLDLYDMRFLYVSMSKKTLDITESEIATYDDVFCEQLQELFTQSTGMYTHL